MWFRSTNFSEYRVVPKVQTHLLVQPIHGWVAYLVRLAPGRSYVCARDFNPVRATCGCGVQGSVAKDRLPFA
jgi:hypothetical protein